MKVAIVKYNAGNVRSVSFALERLGVEPLITDDKEELRSADKIIFPGVGEASSAMNYLHEHKLDELIVQLKQPVLGICLGMQLMCAYSEEGNTNCLGIFNQEVKRFDEQLSSAIKIPHMGWNTISQLKTNLFKDVAEDTYMYFVHGYYVALGNNTIAQTEYGLNYSSALNRNNFYAVQFHPEKSANEGQKIINNFLQL